jgi:hypothetical protein
MVMYRVYYIIDFSNINIINIIVSGVFKISFRGHSYGKKYMGRILTIYFNNC